MDASASRPLNDSAGRARSAARRVRWVLPTLLAVLFVTVSVAFATPPRALGAIGFDSGWWTADRVRQELDRTDQVLRRATQSVGGCASQRAQVLLQKATEMQRSALSLYSPTRPNIPVERIIVLTRKARDLAVDAIEACQVEFQAQEELRTLLDTTADLLRQAGTKIAGAPNPAASRLLQAGTEQLDRAREAYRAGEYRRAITLGGAARSLVQRATQRAEGDARGGAPGYVEAALDRAEMLLAEVRLTPGADSDPRARAMLDRSEKDLEHGRELLDKGRPGAAWSLAVSSRESALDALWMLQRTPEPSLVQKGVDLVARFLADVEPEITASSSDEARKFLEKAREQITLARASLQSGDLAGAVQSVRTADALLRRASDMAGR